MKTLKLSFFALVVLCFAACQDDDDTPAVCTQSDWVGSYSGTVTCDGDTDDVEVTITASGTDNIVIEYTVTDTANTVVLTTTYDPLPFNSCDFSNMASGGGFTASIMADLSGNSLSLSETLSDSTTTSTCQIMATRN
ncbi:MAG: hypothetical protein AAGA31_04595 [Bacteroidota bacterium]